MGLGEAIHSGYRNSFRYSGRATRAEYWYFILFTTILNVFSRILLAVSKDQPVSGKLALALIALVIALVQLSAAVPAVALQVRRLHDVGQSGWWVVAQLASIVFALLILIPGAIAHRMPMIFVGAGLGVVFVILSLILLFFMVQPSSLGFNKYGGSDDGGFDFQSYR